jgi:hypothetical protein
MDICPQKNGPLQTTKPRGFKFSGIIKIIDYLDDA